MWLSIYHPPYHSITDIVPAEVKRNLLLVSLEVIERSHRLEIGQRSQQWAWIFRSFVQWHAIAYILAGLCQLQHYVLGQDFVSRAWQRLDHIFQERNEHDGSNFREGKLWLALTKLFNRAKIVQKNTELCSTDDRPHRSKQDNATTHGDQAKKYRNPTKVTNNPLPQNMGASPQATLQYLNSTYGMMSTTIEVLPVPGTTTSLPLNQYQHHPPGVCSDDLPLATQQVATDPYNSLLFPVSDINFPIMAIDSATDANRLVNPGAASEYSGPVLDWQQWDTIMRDLQFDVQ